MPDVLTDGSMVVVPFSVSVVLSPDGTAGMAKIAIFF